MTYNGDKKGQQSNSIQNESTLYNSFYKDSKMQEMNNTQNSFNKNSKEPARVGLNSKLSNRVKSAQLVSRS